MLRTGYPVVVTGDMNERDLFLCRFTGGVQMHAANGGSNNGRCRPPSPAQIDWIFGSRQVRFSNYQALRNDQVVHRTTDHPLVVATLDVSGQAPVSDSFSRVSEPGPVRLLLGA